MILFILTFYALNDIFKLTLPKSDNIMVLCKFFRTVILYSTHEWHLFNSNEKKIFSLHKKYKIKYNNSFCIRCYNCVYVTTLRYFQELDKMNGKFNKDFTSSCKKEKKWYQYQKTMTNYFCEFTSFLSLTETIKKFFIPSK